MHQPQSFRAAGKNPERAKEALLRTCVRKPLSKDVALGAGPCFPCGVIGVGPWTQICPDASVQREVRVLRVLVHVSMQPITQDETRSIIRFQLGWRSTDLPLSSTRTFISRVVADIIPACSSGDVAVK